MKCKDCVHYDVCGEEGIDDPAMTFCGYFIDKADFAKWYCANGAKALKVNNYDTV